MAELKYIHLTGRAEIGKDQDGRLTFVLFDDAGKPINKDQPFVFAKTLVNPAVEPENVVKLKYADLVLEFGTEQFEVYKATLMKIDSSLGDWDKLEDSDNDGSMNPIGPPFN